LPFVSALAFAARGGGTGEVAPSSAPTAATGSSGQVLLGQNVFFGKQRYFCYVCHSIGDHEGNGRGPDLNELPRLAARAGRGALEPFIRESILDPDAYTEPGFEKGLMAEVPGIPSEVTPAQLKALVASLTAAAKP
jgi:hypothetical protein